MFKCVKSSSFIIRKSLHKVDWCKIGLNPITIFKFSGKTVKNWFSYQSKWHLQILQTKKLIHKLYSKDKRVIPCEKSKKNKTIFYWFLTLKVQSIRYFSDKNNLFGFFLDFWPFLRFFFKEISTFLKIAKVKTSK